MKIIKLSTYLVRPRWCFLKIETDEGITGWGEPVIEGRAATVKQAVIELSDYLIGQDPMDIEGIWNMLYRSGFYRGGPILMSAISGIDQALWDIKGKYFNTPVFNLMGGKARDKIAVYSWIGGDRPSEVMQAAVEKRDLGFRAIKMNATEELQYIDSYKKVDKLLERVNAVRSAAGPDLGIALDFHGRVHKPMAKILLKELEPFRLMFIEELVLSENLEAFAELARLTNIPLAAGERLYSKWDFKRLLEMHFIDIIQPDVSHAGGITETKKIASMAEAYDTGLAPHCPLGPIALASCLQVDATCHNAFIQEQSIGIHYNEGRTVLDYIDNKEDFNFVDGYVDLPHKPGLGIVMNEELIEEEASRPHNWKNPVWKHEDGSIAEW